jgi:hypothetical protein
MRYFLYALCMNVLFPELLSYCAVQRMMYDCESSLYIVHNLSLMHWKSACKVRPCCVTFRENNVCISAVQESRDLDSPNAFRKLAKHLEECYAIIDTLPKFADTGEPITPNRQVRLADGRVVCTELCVCHNSQWSPVTIGGVYARREVCPVTAGQTLPNGATVVDAKRIKTGRWCVLAVWQRGRSALRPINEYIVWDLDPKTLECDNGKYRATATEAAKIFDSLE